MRSCKTCNTVKPLSDFSSYKHPNGVVYRAHNCKLCRNVANRERNWKRVGIVNATLAAYKQQLINQDFKCAVCNTDLVEHKNMHNAAHLDHDHTTGLARGVLCNGCNAGLGMFKDDTKRLQSAIDYLLKYKDSYA